MKPSTQNVKSIRESLNMTQAELAERLGIDRSSLAHMENGRPVPRYIALLLASLVDRLRAEAAA
jgi:putative transcriptional regulator